MSFFRNSGLYFSWRPTLHCFLLLLLLRFRVRVLGLNGDGVFLLSFKYSVLSDPLWVLENWNYDDVTPCLWNGVICAEIAGANDASRVISLILPNSQLLGSISPDLGLIEHLRHIDLSNNVFNGTLPNLLFNASELTKIELANNKISGQLPELVGNLQNLVFLNLSENALTGKIPDNVGALPNLTVLSLSNNYLMGNIPSGFARVEVLDLSMNLLNGSVPSDFGGDQLRYLNLSSNSLSGEISPEFASRSPANATIDLSFNNLTGPVPETGAFPDQKPESFAGNVNLCGKPLKNQCSIQSTPSVLPPNVSTTSPPAIAAIPKTIDGSDDGALATNGTRQQRKGGLTPGAIAGIVVGDLAGIGILFMIFIYIYQAKKKRDKENSVTADVRTVEKRGNDEYSSSDSGGLRWSCLRKKSSNNEETSESTGSETDEEESFKEQKQQKKPGSLVTLDGEPELELETLLKASAYILGATGSSIVYKAVLEDGATFAVRRIGESGVERFRDFENQVRLIAKLRHPNLVRVRGFYWGEDEKLVIYDYVPNGSLASTRYKKSGSSSPCHLPWEARLRIARGIARGLSYLHEKKFVHGNLKPSNILLGPDMEPRIGDFGLERLVSGDSSNRPGLSARHFGSKRSTHSRDSVQELPVGASPGAGSAGGVSPYHAPESLQNLKPSPKWDVYSFGIVLLELLAGRGFSDQELSQWSSNSFAVEERNRVVRMADVSLRPDVEGKEDTLVACFRLGFSCASVVPQKRPSMKEALQILEKLPSSHLL